MTLLRAPGHRVERRNYWHGEVGGASIRTGRWIGVFSNSNVVAYTHPPECLRPSKVEAGSHFVASTGDAVTYLSRICSSVGVLVRVQ
jgi:hypothetical protein